MRAIDRFGDLNDGCINSMDLGLLFAEWEDQV